MSFFRRFGPGWWLRLVGLGILDSIVVALIPGLLDQGANVALVSILVGTAGINYIFLSARTYPLRWLVPGLTFLVVLMIWPIVFTVWVALTNWSTGNFIEKDSAIERITESPRFLISGDEAPLVDLFLYRDADNVVTVLVRRESGALFYGVPRFTDAPASESELLDLADFATTDEDGDGIPETIDGATKLRLVDLSSLQGILDRIVLDIPDVGQVRPRTFSSATLAVQRFEYDPDRDVLIDNLTGESCPVDNARFVCPTAGRLDPGWREYIGFDNFQSALTDERVRDPFLRVLVWNIVFATAVVFFQLVLGLGLALTFQDARMKFRRFYRSLLIIPYAAPAFITVIVWRGLLNTSFGPVNDLIDPIVTIFRDGPIPWLQDPFWAKVAVIVVSVWQGFAYFFLITTGALQSIPSELQEAARVDGASSAQVFRRVTFPLLMVAIAPLIIASFAYNFNAFVNIFLLTSGGPPITGYAVPVGETDILISFTFNLAIASGRGGNFALAAAFTFFIFFIVATISIFSFRFTKRLETVYGNL